MRSLSVGGGVLCAVIVVLLVCLARVKRRGEPAVGVVGAGAGSKEMVSAQYGAVPRVRRRV